MAIYVNDLLIDALKTVRLVTPFQMVRPEYLTDALNLLHELISTLNASEIMIPYQTDLTFNLIANQRTYRIAPTGIVDVIHQAFASINYINLYWQSIQYPVAIITDLNDLNIYKAMNINTIPDSARVHNLIADDTNEPATDIIFFNAPDQAYQCKIRGKAYLVQPTLQTDITGLPDYYQRYFRLWVAKEITRYYPTNGLTQQDQQDLMLAENLVRSSSDLDLWVRVPGYLSKRDPYLYNTRLGVRT